MLYITFAFIKWWTFARIAHLNLFAHCAFDCFHELWLFWTPLPCCQSSQDENYLSIFHSCFLIFFLNSVLGIYNNKVSVVGANNATVRSLFPVNAIHFKCWTWWSLWVHSNSECCVVLWFWNQCKTKPQKWCFSQVYYHAAFMDFRRKYCLVNEMAINSQKYLRKYRLLECVKLQPLWVPQRHIRMQELN